MKKIKKIDPKTAQSVYSFACPCIGSCGTCYACGCSSSLTQSGFNGSKIAISTANQYPTAARNYG